MSSQRSYKINPPVQSRMCHIERRLSEFAWERDTRERTFEECNAMMRNSPRYMRAVFVCRES